MSFRLLIKNEWRLLLFGFLLTGGSSFGQTFFIALFSDEVRSALNLSHGAFGAIYSLATILSAGLLLFTGPLIDSLPLRRVSVIIAIGLAAGCIALSQSTGALTLLVAMLLLRHFGQGLMTLTGLTAVMRYIEFSRGRANALAGSGYTLAEAILPLVAVAALSLLGWRGTWLLWAGVIIALLLPATLLLLRGHADRHAAYVRSLDNAPAEDGSGKRHWTRGEMLRDPMLYLFLPALMANPLLFTGFMFHQVQLTTEKGWPLPFWASLFVVYAITGSIVKLLAGVLVDRLSAQRVVAMMHGPNLLAFLCLALSDHRLAAVAFMLLLGVSTGLYTTVATPFYAERYGTRHLGAIKSTTTSFMVLATALAPVAMGLGLDRGLSMDAMAVAALAYLVVATALAALANHLTARQA